MSEVFRTVVPRLLLAVLLLSGSFFAFFESVYLRDQSSEIGEMKIAVWMWVFRVLTAILAIAGCLLLLSFVRTLLF